MRGLCNGLGPALFGLLFWMTDVHLSDDTDEIDTATHTNVTMATATPTNNVSLWIYQNVVVGRMKAELLCMLFPPSFISHPPLPSLFLPQQEMFLGIPFLIGAFPVLLALLVAFCIHDNSPIIRKTQSEENIPLREPEHKKLRTSVSSIS